MKLNKKVISSITCISALACFAPFAFLSCSKNTFDGNKLLITGPDKIFIDHTLGAEVTGFSTQNFIVTYGGVELDNGDLVWELIDCDDPNISINHGTINWNNPTLINHTFKVKASFYDEQLQNNVFGFSNNVTLMASSESAKVEFIYNGYNLPYLIKAKSGEEGKHDGNWTFKLNGKPYVEKMSPLKLKPKSGSTVPGIYIDDNGQIKWDKTLATGVYELYLCAKIVDSSTGVSYDVLSTNNPIVLEVDKPNLFFEVDEQINKTIDFKSKGEITSYKVYNYKAEDITDKDTTTWRINVKKGPEDLKDYVNVSKGVVTYTDSLPKGDYAFTVTAADNTQGKVVTSQLIELKCVSPCKVTGGNTEITANCSTVGSDLLHPWYLEIDDEAVGDANFEIVPCIDAHAEMIEKLKQYVSCESIQYEGKKGMYLKWQPGLDASIYIFKIKATYNDKTAFSEPVRFRSYNEGEPFLNLKTKMTKISLVKTDSYSKDYDSYISSLPISAYFSTFQPGEITPRELLIARPEIKYTFEGLDGTEIKIDNDEHLHINRLAAIQSQGSWQKQTLTITGEYNYASKVLKDSITIEINIGSLTPDSNLLKICGESYNYWKSEAGQDHCDVPGDSIQLNLTAPPKYPNFMVKGNIESFLWKKPAILKHSDNVVAIDLLDIEHGWTDGSKPSRYAQYQTALLSVPLPPHTKKTVLLNITTEMKVYAKRKVDRNDYPQFSFRNDVYDLGPTLKLPNYIHGVQIPKKDPTWETGIDLKKKFRKEDNAIITDREIFNDYDSTSTGVGHSKWIKHNTGEKHPLWTKTLLGKIELINDSDIEKKVEHYLGFSIITGQPGAACGPFFHSFWMKFRFSFEQQVDELIN